MSQKKSGKEKIKKIDRKRQPSGNEGLKGCLNMSIERVRKEFEQYGIADRILELDESSATVDLATKALGCEPDHIAKTLSFMGNDGPILVVTSGLGRVHSGKFKRTFHTKATMLKADEVEDVVGHAVGGVCPFGVKDNVSVYLDESLKKYETVFPACGSSNSAIELTLPELEKYSHSKGWVDVCKDK